MNTLNKLKTMNDKQIQAWLKKVDSQSDAKTLAIALVGSDEDVKNCVFRNMTKRAGNVLAEDINRNKTLNIKEQIITAQASLLEKLM